VGDLLASICLSHLLHLAYDRSHNLFGREIPGFVPVLDVDHRLVAFAVDLKRPVFHVLQETLGIHVAAHEPPEVKDGVFWMRRKHVLGGIADQTLLVTERNPRRRASVPVVVGENMNAIVKEDGGTGVCIAQIYSRL
jgi:hypothetical protein